MGYNISKGYVHCWACGPHRVSPTLSEITGRRVGEIIDLLKGVILERVPDALQTSGVLKLPEGLEDELRPGHRKYLRGRGYDPDRLQRLWGIKGLGPYAGKLSWRIFIPIYYRHELVSWTTRSICDTHAMRYRSARLGDERINHKQLLYGEDYAGNSIIIVEGPLDVWAIGPGAVATCGTAYTRHQVNRMVKYPRRAVCLDNEPDGIRRSKKLVDELSLYDGDTYNVRLSYKDASETLKNDPKEIRRLRQTFLTV